MRPRSLLFTLVSISLLPLVSVALEPSSDLPTLGERLTRLQGSASLGRNRDVAGATVTVMGVERPGLIFVTASDHRGLFSIDGLPDGEYRVELRREGLKTVVKDGIDLAFPARPVVEVLMAPRGEDGPVPSESESVRDDDPEIRLRGRVGVRGGDRIAGARIRLRPLDGSSDPLRVISNDDGGFSLASIAPGSWQLEARVAGFLPLRTRLTLAEDTDLRLSMVKQGAGYTPSPYELMPPEQVVPPQEP